MTTGDGREVATVRCAEVYGAALHRIRACSRRTTHSHGFRTLTRLGEGRKMRIGTEGGGDGVVSKTARRSMSPTSGLRMAPVGRGGADDQRELPA